MNCIVRIQILASHVLLFISFVCHFQWICSCVRYWYIILQLQEGVRYDSVKLISIKFGSNFFILKNLPITSSLVVWTQPSVLRNDGRTIRWGKWNRRATAGRRDIFHLGWMFVDAVYFEARNKRKKLNKILKYFYLSMLTLLQNPPQWMVRVDFWDLDG